MRKVSIPGCMNGNAGWATGEYHRPEMISHPSDQLIMFIGGNPDDHENLNAEVEIWIENDPIILTQSSIVFIPEGKAFGNISVRYLKQPFFHYTCLVNTDEYKSLVAEPTAMKGTFSNNWIEKYAPMDGFLPEAPEGFLTRLLWIDSAKLKGSPYLESVWFLSLNDTGPENHSHDFDEIIGFFGSDTNHPEELNAEISILIDGETVSFTTSCLIYIPRSVKHSPILVPRLDKPVIHFSGGNGGDYIRKGGAR